MKMPKRTSLAVLVILLILPIMTLAIYQSRYTALENSICQRDDTFKEACDYPERFETYRGLNTNFYRHIGDIFGREFGTSPSFDYLIKEYAEDNVSDLRRIDNQASLERAADISSELENAMTDIGAYNRSLFIALFATTIIASVATTLLVQRIYRSIRKFR